MCDDIVKIHIFNPAFRCKRTRQAAVEAYEYRASRCIEGGIGGMGLRSFFKGFYGEALSSIAHKLMLDEHVYRELNNITILTPAGTTQIDHIIVSCYGIFVTESKNMGGWIFGKEKDAEWTQAFPGGKKFRFQNPLRQNYMHIKCLSEFLHIDHDKFHSVVMFRGNSTFKTPMPENVLDGGYAAYIKSKTEVLLPIEDVDRIVEALKTGRMPWSWATHNDHVSPLKERRRLPR